MCVVLPNPKPLSGYYIIQFVARNLAGRASVIAGRDPTTASWMIS